MNQFEVVTTMFDTAAWSIGSDQFSRESKETIFSDLQNIVRAIQNDTDYSRYEKIDGIWTQTGRTDKWMIANTCLNKRNSFFVVTSGQVLALTTRGLVRLMVGDEIELGPHTSAVFMGAPHTRVLRVFVKTREEFNTFMEKYHG